MKKGSVILVMLFSVWGGLCVQGQSVKTSSIPALGLVISDSKVTSLIFPYPIKKGFWVSEGLTVRQLEGAENILMVKANRPGFEQTNLSVVTTDGQFYSFLIDYGREPSVLNLSIAGNLPADRARAQLSDMPVTAEKLREVAMRVMGKAPFLPYRIRQQKVELRLPGLYLADNQLWLYLTVKNRSLLDYPPEYVRFFIQDKKRSKRTVVQEKELSPVFAVPMGTVKGRTTVHWAVAFTPFTIGRGQQLVIKVAEKNGGRTLVLPVSHKALLKTRQLP